MKLFYSNPLAYLELNEDKLKAIQLKSGTRQCCTFSPYIANLVQEILARVNNTTEVAENLCTNWNRSQSIFI